MQICISNVYGDTNKGGSLLTLAAVQAVERANPACEITLMALDDPTTSLAESARRMPNVGIEGNPLNLGSSAIDRARRIVSLTATSHRPELPTGLVALGTSKGSSIWSTDAVLAKGGQLFRDYPTRRALRSFRASALPLLLAQKRGIPSFAYGVQVGPYSSAAASAEAKSIIRRLSFAVLRDEASAKVLRGWGLENFIVAPDTIFGIDVPELDNRVADDLEGPYALLTVHYAFEHRKLLPRVEKILRALLKSATSNELSRIYVAHQADSGSDRDPEVARRLVAQIGDPRIQLLPDVASAEQLLAVQARARFVVSGRVHGALMPLLVGTPGFIVDGWSDKGRDIFCGAGLEQYVVPANGSLDDRLCEQIIDGSLGSSEHRREIAHQVQINRGQVRGADARLEAAQYS